MSIAKSRKDSKAYGAQHLQTSASKKLQRKYSKRFFEYLILAGLSLTDIIVYGCKRLEINGLMVHVIV